MTDLLFPKIELIRDRFRGLSPPGVSAIDSDKRFLHELPQGLVSSLDTERSQYVVDEFEVTPAVTIGFCEARRSGSTALPVCPTQLAD
jgi:hypothetical protein